MSGNLLSPKWTFWDYFWFGSTVAWVLSFFCGVIVGWIK